MLDDPGRKELQEDINIHGYQWLDEYWENILAGPKNESAFIWLIGSFLTGTRTMVELVKTPARRKDTHKRVKENNAITRMKTIPDVPLEVTHFFLPRAFFDCLIELGHGEREHAQST
jgi:hypothetical protein